MSRKARVVCVAVLFGLACSGLVAAGEKPRNEPKAPEEGAAAQLPQTLANYYPPKSKEPVFFLKMVELATLFDGILVNYFEKDGEGTRGSFERFKQTYGDLAAMAPAWAALFPAQPVDALARNLQSPDVGAFMASYEAVGNACTLCHRKYGAAVMYKYRWPDYKAVMVKDPVTGQEMDFRSFMFRLSSSFSGTMVSVGEGQTENARKHFQDFAMRFKSMETSCSACHADERHYYAGDALQPLVEGLGKAVASSDAGMDQVGGFFQGIGMESCTKCHMVHMPAALSRHQDG